MFEFIIFSTILFIIYRYLIRNNNYWTKSGINGPKPILLFGNFLDRMRYSMSTIDMEYRKKFGSIYGVFNGTEPALQVGEPDLIKQILVRDFDKFSNRRELRTDHSIINKNLFHSRVEDWRRLRSIMSSTFTSGKMKKMYPMVRKCLEEYLEHLEGIADRNEEFNANKIHQSFTMDVIASCAFATQTNGIKDPNNPFVVNGRKIFDFPVIKMIPAFVFPKYLNKLLNIRSFFSEDANDFMFCLSREIVKNRRNRLKNGHKMHEKYNDFIQLLIDAKADENNENDLTDNLESHHINEGEDNIQNSVLKANFSNKTLTEDEIIAQSWVFLIAGFETTATTLGYLSYVLALNPECQQRLYEEVMSALDSDGEISYDVLQRLSYLDAVITETLRLFPSVNRLEREATQTVSLGDTGITLRKGQVVEIPVYAVHHSEEYYKNADQFIPERFLPENRHKLIPYSYLPFGTGPRNCIGMRFGLMEIKLTIVHIIKGFRFEKCPKTEIPLKFMHSTLMLKAESIHLRLEKR